jgi:hypothetical protein
MQNFTWGLFIKWVKNKQSTLIICLTLISGFIVLQSLWVSGFWHGKKGLGKDKHIANRKSSKHYVKINNVLNYSERKKSTGAVCKSYKFSEKVKTLYKCKGNTAKTYSSKKSPKLSLKPRIQPSCKDDNM